MGRHAKNTLPVLERPRRSREDTGSLIELENGWSDALGYVRELEEAARSIREKGFTGGAFDTISSVGTRLEKLFGHHEEIEEEVFFPELRKSDPDSVRGFSQEHRAARVLFAKLFSIIRDIEGGRIHGSSVGDLLRTIRELVTLLRSHIIHEGDVLAPFVRQKAREKQPGLRGINSNNHRLSGEPNGSIEN